MKGTSETEVRFPRDVGDWVEAAFLGVLQEENLAAVEPGRKDSQQGGKCSVRHQSSVQVPYDSCKDLGNRAAAK